MMKRIGLVGPLAQAARIVRRGGLAELRRRSIRRIGRFAAAHGEIALTLRPEEIADTAAAFNLPSIVRVERERRLTVGWICTPPAPGSGGHTTMFRFVRALEDAGHRCVVFLYDIYDGDLARHEAIIRAGWPHVRAEIRDYGQGLAPIDAYVATSWETAHALASASTFPTARFYLVQDFEPYFYGHGSEYALAEETYRFGFRCITVGHGLAKVLDDHYGVESTVAEFGSDRGVYGLRSAGVREGVVFYARPEAARRGYELGVLALKRFHNMRPAVPIHIFGRRARELPFAVQHGFVTPSDLSRLYNRCVAGLVLSFTNISLVPYELLACGAIPVLNDTPLARCEFANPYVRWARPTPQSLAAELVAVIDDSGGERLANEAAASCTALSWTPACEAVVAAIEAGVYRDPDR